jgi:hypothetical protein
MSSRMYGQFMQYALADGSFGGFYAADLNMGLMGAGYTPDFSTNAHYSDIDTNEVTGTGYTSGGVALSGRESAITAADSYAGDTWVASSTPAFGDVIVPVTMNGYLYRCVVSGETNGSEPDWTTAELTGQIVEDNDAVWMCLGSSIYTFGTDPAEWTGATFDAYYGILYDTTSQLLIACIAFDTPQSPSDQDFTVTPDANLGWLYFSPPG